MSKRIALVLAAAMCMVVPACNQPTAPSPTPTVIVTDTTVPPAPAPSSAVPGTMPPAADGSTGNDVSPEYCATNQDPACPVGSFVGPDAIPNPNGDGSFVPCEGTICTNPNYGANTDTPETGEPDPGDETS